MESTTTTEEVEKIAENETVIAASNSSVRPPDTVDIEGEIATIDPVEAVPETSSDNNAVTGNSMSADGGAPQPESEVPVTANEEKFTVDASSLKERLKLSLKRKHSTEDPVSATTRSRHVRIDNFQRPLNIKGLVQWLSELRGISISEDAVWINGIKTHCYLDLSNEEEAEKFILAVTGQRYPATNNNTLVATFTNISAKDAPQSAEASLKVIEKPKPTTAQKPRDLEELKNSLKKRKVDGGEGNQATSVNLFKRATVGALSGPQTVTSSPGNGRTVTISQPTGASFLPPAEVTKAVLRVTETKPELTWLPVDDAIADRRIKLYRRLGNRV